MKWAWNKLVEFTGEGDADLIPVFFLLILAVITLIILGIETSGFAPKC